MTGPEDDDPKFRELLRQVSEVDVPDYPDWSRGWKWGLFSGAFTAFIIFLVIFISGPLASFWQRLQGYGFGSLGIAFAVFLIVGAVGAFRPDNQ